MLKLLVVEDDPIKFNTIKSHLHETEVTHCTSIRSGMIAMRDASYDGVILDMGLPLRDDGGGYAPDNGMLMLQELAKNSNEIPVLVVSGNEFDISRYSNVLGYIKYCPTIDISSRMFAFMQEV